MGSLARHKSMIVDRLIRVSESESPFFPVWKTDSNSGTITVPTSFACSYSHYRRLIREFQDTRQRDRRRPDYRL